MVDLSYYNNEIDKILADIIGNESNILNKSFEESEMTAIINIITNTIRQYHKKLSKSKLKLIVTYLMEQKFRKYFIFDPHSEFNMKNKNSGENENDENDESLSLSFTDEGIYSCNNYINSELEQKPIRIESFNDLVSHRYDCIEMGNDKKRKLTQNNYNLIEKSNRIEEIKKIPQHEQQTTGWYEERNQCLTATAIATILDEDPYNYPIEILLDKCGRGKQFEENEYVHHGKKYEQVGNMFYSFRNNVKVGEYGLLRHNKYPFVGASPDGICEKTTNDGKLSKLVGRLLEIKFPKTRKINTKGKLDGDICPHQYYIQVQTQLFVTGMDECDFLQCKIDEYGSWQEFIDDSRRDVPGLSKITNLEKGCLIQLLPKKMAGGDPLNCLYNAKYLYQPDLHMTNEDIGKWISKEIFEFHQNELNKNYLVDRVIYWRLSYVTCYNIKADSEWFESKIPVIRQFWDYVLFYRSNNENLDALVEFVEKVGIKNSAEIFDRVHKDFVSVKKDSKYLPFYGERNKWRVIFDKKKESFQNYLNYRNRYSGNKIV